MKDDFVKELMLGNEAIAFGALDAGITVLSAYPGTPSTEIAQTASNFKEMNAQWAVNEKVAAEVAMGASIAGARAMCCMKHVGLNVASEVLFTGAYTGVNGALIFVVADDPGMHSSQNEQDTRMIASAAHVPVLEPSDCQQAYDFVAQAVELSEAFDIPVIVRLTTRIAHSRGFVVRRETDKATPKSYQKNASKYVMMPSNAIERKKSLLLRQEALSGFAETSLANTVEKGDGIIGVICSGICYEYVKEALLRADIFHIGIVNPLPKKAVTDFAKTVQTLYVVEEQESYMEQQIKSWGIGCIGSEVFSKLGELSVSQIRKAVLGENVEVQLELGLPPRPPVLCAGCPHRAVFYLLKKLKATVFGDIGCYTLGAVAPLNSMDTTICMGASIGTAHGAELAMGREFARNSVAVIGDSTFFHSGLSGLASAAYNLANTTVLILDNSITGMTGHQDNPGTGITLQGQQGLALSIEKTCEALGASMVSVVDPVDQKALENALRKAWQTDGVKVIVARRPCVLIIKPGKPLTVNQDCIGCGICVSTGCPSLRLVNKKAVIDSSSCNGCGLCLNICPKGCLEV